MQSDHKPLENIHRKPLLSAPKRLQRMLLRLQKYDINAIYVPCRKMLLADTLSRAYIPDSTKGDTETEIKTVNMADYLPISAERLSSIRAATKEDLKLRRVMEMILTGWPPNKSDIPKDRVEGCLRHAKECVYWQGMKVNIKTFISKCDICTVPS